MRSFEHSVVSLFVRLPLKLAEHPPSRQPLASPRPFCYWSQSHSPAEFTVHADSLFPLFQYNTVQYKFI